MNAESKFPILCRAKQFLQFAKQTVVPTWHDLIADQNLQFITSGEDEQVALSQLLDPPVDLKERTWESIDAFAAKNQSFALLSCDGSDPASEWDGQSEVIKVTLANRRLNPDLKALLELPFPQQCDLIVSDYLPEESNVNDGEEESSAVSLPPSFSFVPPSIPPLSRRGNDAQGPLLWVVDPISMVSGLINEKVASTLGNMEEDKHLEVICIEPDSSKDLELTNSLAKASAILAVTGDPALGHFLVRSASQLGIPVIFPLEEPCSPLRFTAEELGHYAACNNYGRSGLSTRGLLSKAVKHARPQTEGEGKALEPRDEEPVEAPSSLWRRMIEERKSGQPSLPPCPNGHEITRLESEDDFEPVPDYELPPVESNDFDVTLTPRPWMAHPNFTQSILALQQRSEVTESIPLTSAIADLLSEHLLELKPDAEVASRLIRNLARKNPAWLERLSEDIYTWRKSGVVVDVARSIWASHTDYSEIASESLNARKQEFQGLANLLVQQVNSNLVSPYMPNPLFRFLSALNLVEEHMDAISKVFAAHPANDRLYRVLLNFWGLVNGNSEACQTLAPTYNDPNNVNLAHGHLFLFLGMANDSLPDAEEAVGKSLSMGYLEKWMDGPAWDRLMTTFVLALIGLEEEAKQQFDETIAANPLFSPFAGFFAKIPGLRSSEKSPLSETLLDEIRQKLQQKE